MSEVEGRDGVEGEGVKLHVNLWEKKLTKTELMPEHNVAQAQTSNCHNDNPIFRLCFSYGKI